MRVPAPSFTLLIACMIALAGCDQSSPLHSDAISTAGSTNSFSEVIPYGNPPKSASVDFTSEQGAFLRQQYGSLRAELVDILESDEPLHETSRRADQLLRLHSEHPLAPYLEQFAGHGILRRLLEEPNPPAATIGHYVTLLLRNENPDAELIHATLQRLTGEWPRYRIEAAARATSLRARQWTRRVCPDCTDDRSAKAVRNEGLMLKHERILEAAKRLDDFVGP